jgi:CheY-like chemotaxis protein
MPRVKLIHWKAEEIEERAKILRESGYEVDSNLEGGSQLFRHLGENPPAAIIIDLSRLPSQGRDFGLMIRKRKTTRNIPLVFAGGDQEKVKGVQKLLPDASYTSWEEISTTLKCAITNPPAEPIVHESTFAGYAGKPLVEKLGIKVKMTVSIVSSPDDFDKTLGSLPSGVNVHLGEIEECDLTIWFCRSQRELVDQINTITAQARSGPVWIAWPKKKSGEKSDLTQTFVRQTGLGNNLVDYKISSFDETWSGLLFRHREKN